MRGRSAAICILVAAVLGAAAGAAVGAETSLPGTPSTAAPTPSGPAPTSTGPTSPGPTGTGSPRPVVPADLLQAHDLGAAGWSGPTTTATVQTDPGDLTVSPCQRPGPFVGLGHVVVGRWRGPDGRAGEAAAEAPDVDDARLRAEQLYEQHLSCAELVGRTVGVRHAVAVDGGSVTWFEVDQGGTRGYSAVLRQSNRFALVYLDRGDVTQDGLTALLRTASHELA